MLVGRDAECQAIDALLAGARLGQSGVLVLTGEPGIGKTAMLEYAVAAAGEIRVLRATGSEAERDLAFGGLAQLLRPTEADLLRLPEPQAEALGVALALRSGRGTDRFGVGAATLSLLVRYSEDRPLGLFIDDAHLLDPASADAIAFAVRRLVADSVAVIAAARSGEPCALTAPDIPQRALGGLDLPAVHALLKTRTDGPWPRSDAERIRARSGGNPLAVLELGAFPDVETPGSPAPMPAVLVEAFARRLDVHGPQSRAAVLLAATAGGDLGVMRRAAGVLGLDLTAALDPVEDAALLRVLDDRVEFTHPLVRAAVYAAAGGPQRRRTHAAVAAALPIEDADRRAWHRAGSVIGPDPAVAAELAAVGGRAADRGAHSVAATAYERAARLCPDEPDRAGLLLAGGEAAWRAGDAVRARALLGESAGLDPHVEHRARVHGLIGEIDARSGSLEAARSGLLTAAGEMVATDPDQALLLLAQTVNACFYLGDSATALAAAEQADALLGSHPQLRAAAIGTMAAGMARVLAGEGGADQIRRGVAMMAVAEPWPDHAVHSSWQVLGPLFMRESGTGRQLVRAAVDDRRAHATVGGLPFLLFHIARDGATTDHWAGAEADYTESIGLARETGQTTDLAMSLAGLAWLEARLGRTADALGHAAEALDLCHERQIHFGAAWAQFAVGELELSRGRATAAAERLTALESWLSDIGVRDVDLSPGPELAEAALLLGERYRAERVAAAYADRAAAKGQPWALARAARMTLLLATDDELDRSFTAALQLHDRTLDIYETARTRLVYGSRLRRARRRVDARVPLREALLTFQSLGARLWAATAVGELRATGSNVRAGATGVLDELTSRERQIAVLLAEGRTTRETAAALFVSPKTVEYHVRHIYTKLDIASRAELADRMAANSL